MLKDNNKKAMKLSTATMNELKEILQAEYRLDLSDQELFDFASRFINYFDLLLQINSKQTYEYQQQN